jgi:hypothetical protein
MPGLTPAYTLRLRRQGLFDRGNYLVKRRGIGYGQIGENLAIQLNLGLEQPIDENAVAQAALAHCGIDANDPQLAELPFPIAAIPKGIDSGAEESFFGSSQQATTPADKSLHLVKETLLSLISGGTFYGTHRYLSLK